MHIPLQEMPMCVNAIDKYIVEICLNSSSWTCFNVSDTSFMLPERLVVATFTNLVENKQYSAFVYVQFNGGVTWKSQSSVNISEYCVLYIDCKTFKNVIQQLLMFGKSKWFQ